MAEFCAQCAKDLDFPPDFKGLTTRQQTLNGIIARVLCEECGMTSVDHEGVCLGVCELENHKFINIKQLQEKYMDLFKDIKEFHEKFALEYNERPRELPWEMWKFRSQFLEEELIEYRQAYIDQNLEKQLDALVDLVYVAVGTAYLHGFDFNEAWRRIHAANMKKIRGGSERSAEFDVIKPPGWVAPDLSDLVQVKE